MLLTALPIFFNNSSSSPPNEKEHPNKLPHLLQASLSLIHRAALTAIAAAILLRFLDMESVDVKGRHLTVAALAIDNVDEVNLNLNLGMIDNVDEVNLI